ncbi:MAG: glycosyltransferase, partial [Acidobacteriota bacterium]|nr:glycosyltransferase [Acidobacteriota bacterium]
ARNILFTRHVSDTCLRALYRSCSLFVFPSEYEGFGLPLAEALASGAPAIASRTSSLTEILDDPAGLFNPHDPAKISAFIERALTDPDTNRTLRELAFRKRREHSWAGVAERVVHALNRLSPREPSRSNPSRLAIALVGPFPPQRTGIADNNFAIARELAQIADLFLFYSGDCDVARLRELRPSGCLPVSDLGTHFAPQYLDAVIYTFGNSAHHVETLDKILEYPGLLWLHDVHVADLYDSYRTRAGLRRDEYIADTARKMYGERSPPPVTGIDPFEMDELRCWGLHFTQEILSKSRGVIVSSQHSLHMLALDQRPFSPLPPSWVVPLASPVSNQSERKVARRVGSRAVVSSFGFLGEPKAPDLLMAAVALLPPELAVELRFVGYGGAEYCESLLAHARMLGIEQSVQITGYVNESEWFEHVRQSACAVQLRRHSNGESSAAVLDCVSLGLPIITNIASCREMPEDTVLHVSPEITAHQLRDCLLTLLTDPAEWSRYHEGALRYSASNNIRIAAQKILAAVTELSNGRSGQRE